MKKNLLLIEDDPQQSETITDAIQRRFHDYKVQVMETESEFYKCVSEMGRGDDLPSMVICDVMLPWAFPAPDAPPAPAEVSSGTFRKAGLRCWEVFRKNPRARTVPWIYFTVLDEETIDLTSHSDDRTGYAQKSGSIDPLLKEIEVFQDNEWPEVEAEVTGRMLASPKMRQILRDGLRTPLDHCQASLP